MFKRMKQKQEQKFSRGSSASSNPDYEEDLGTSSAASLSESKRLSASGGNESDSSTGGIVASAFPFPPPGDAALPSIKEAQHSSSDDDNRSEDDRSKRKLGDDDDDGDDPKSLSRKISPVTAKFNKPLPDKFAKWKPQIEKETATAASSVQFSFSALKRTSIHRRKIDRWNSEYNGFGRLIEPFISIKLGMDNRLRYCCDMCSEGKSEESEEGWYMLQRTKNVIAHLKERCSRSNVLEEEKEDVNKAIALLESSYLRNVRVPKLKQRKEDLATKARDVLKQIDEQRAEVLRDLVATLFTETDLALSDTTVLQVKAYMKEVIRLANSNGLNVNDCAVLDPKSVQSEFKAAVERLNKKKPS